MRSTFLLFGLASALALGVGGTALARPGHGGGHFGASHVGGGHVGGMAHFGGGGHYGGGWGGGSHFGGVAGRGAWSRGGHWGYGYGPSFGFGYGYPYGSGLYLGVPLAADWADDYGEVPAYDYSAVPTYGEVVPAGPDTVPAATAQPVTLTVLVPTADAELSLNGTAMTLQGVERKFQSPPLMPGQSYHYQVTAKWVDNGRPVEQTLDVPVAAGQAVTMDFRAPTR